MPQLVLELNGQRSTLDPGRTYSVGRNPQCDFTINDARVSWQHATISFAGNAWLFQDLGSTNGTFQDGRRTTQAYLGNGTVIALGNAENGPRLSFSGLPSAVPAAQPGQGAGADWYDQQTARVQPGQEPQLPQQGGYPQQSQQQSQQPAPQQFPQQGGYPQQQPQQPQQPAHQQFPQQGGYQQPLAQQSQPQPSQGYAAQAYPEPVYGARNPTMVRNLTAGLKTLRIGRGLDNDLVVSDLSVSRHHAELRQLTDGRYEIVDLESHNGTYLNGQPISRQVLGTQDIVGVGHSTFRLVGDRLEEFVDTGEVSFSARHLTVEVEHKGQKKILLNDVSFAVPEKSLIGVIGPSGSGKSTLLRALTGYRPADRGDVLYDGRNLYKQFAELRQRIGLVPQDDILHSQLTVRTALEYAAELRFPGDTEASERKRRVDEVLVELHLEKRADNRITALSGGQRKRVSVALELLTKPSLIFLDEPTSGLDPGMDRDVMKMLRDLADEGRTVLVVTHSVAELALCDRLLVMAPGGSVAYFGPPKEALHFFQCETWADVFQAFENHAEHDWQGRFRGSVHFQMYAADVDAVQAQSAGIQQHQTQPPKQQSWGSQLSTLVRRYVSVIAADRGYVVLLFALPLIMGAMSAAIPAKFGLGPSDPPQAGNHDAATVLLLLAVSASLTGAANAVRELIKERVIYERERAVGLSRSAYVASKIIVLGAITALQSVMVAMIGLLPRKLPSGGLLVSGTALPELVLVVMLLGITSMTLGLVVSALVKTAEKTMPLLVLIAIIQVVFCGSLIPVHGQIGLEQLAWLVPSRWAVAAQAASINLLQIQGLGSDGKPVNDPLWTHTIAQWGMDVGVLVLLGVVCSVLVARLLRRHEPEVMRSR
ncbi:FHA domain-containing protein [Streptacidiphilus jiangxiensis]|uniref:FHA domain-containing protein n=1 Tax=Streptacidiphilus jiangxiensis TaxID=235985 RepID=UPI0005A658DD|nr:FHA domain-containing protein [Streptacidiphilus jiangxiensis]